MANSQTPIYNPSYNQTVPSHDQPFSNKFYINKIKDNTTSKHLSTLGDEPKYESTFDISDLPLPKPNSNTVSIPTSIKSTPKPTYDLADISGSTPTNAAQFNKLQDSLGVGTGSTIPQDISKWDRLKNWGSNNLTLDNIKTATAIGTDLASIGKGIYDVYNANRYYDLAVEQANSNIDAWNINYKDNINTINSQNRALTGLAAQNSGMSNFGSSNYANQNAFQLENQKLSHIG